MLIVMLLFVVLGGMMYFLLRRRSQAVPLSQPPPREEPPQVDIPALNSFGKLQPAADLAEAVADITGNFVELWKLWTKSSKKKDKKGKKDEKDQRADGKEEQKTNPDSSTYDFTPRLQINYGQYPSLGFYT